MEAIYLGELDIDEERSERAERGDTVLGEDSWDGQQHRCPRFPLVGWLIEGFETSPLNNS